MVVDAGIQSGNQQNMLFLGQLLDVSSGTKIPLFDMECSYSNMRPAVAVCLSARKVELFDDFYKNQIVTSWPG